MEGLESFFTASEQLSLFVFSCLFGVPIGIFYDIFRVLRMIFPHGKILVAAEDILFFFLYGVFIMCFTIVAARSEFRFYFCAGNFLGFAVYYFTIGNAVTKVLRKTIMTIKKVLTAILKPVYKKFVLICVKCRDFFVRTLQNRNNNKKKSQNPLNVEGDLLYNNRVHKKNKRKNVKTFEKEKIQTGKEKS